MYKCKDPIDEKYEEFQKKIFEKYYEEPMTKNWRIFISKCKTLLKSYDRT